MENIYFYKNNICILETTYNILKIIPYQCFVQIEIKNGMKKMIVPPLNRNMLILFSLQIETVEVGKKFGNQENLVKIVVQTDFRTIFSSNAKKNLYTLKKRFFNFFIE
jgi:hypothetical protein